MIILALIALYLYITPSIAYRPVLGRRSVLQKRLWSSVDEIKDTITCSEDASILLMTLKDDETSSPLRPGVSDYRNSIVIIAGFEQFNVDLYREAASKVNERLADVPIYVFTDRDIKEKEVEVSLALQQARVLFCSLIFDFNQVKYLEDKLSDIPVRFVFESSLELMSNTQVGEFNMKGGGGAPAPVKALLKQFGSNKEEDRLSGYLKFLKIGPKLLKWIPVTDGKLNDLRNWLTVYAYWTEGGQKNVESMLYRIIKEPSLGLKSEYLVASTIAPVDTVRSAKTSSITAAPVVSTSLVQPIIENPNVGFFHPGLVERHSFDPNKYSTPYLESPKEYEQWYCETHRVTDATPRVGILLYRKHVLTEQQYIPNLIRLMESEGIMPIPIFINGVEGHTVVRDLMTTAFEASSSRPSDSIMVDVIVNTIGFPLVGGPAGSMEGGRGLELARDILSSKNVPYYVAAPLVIQDTNSWSDNGVLGLQQVVLYSLPELDGAIEAVVLGGLVGDTILVLPERVRKLTSRIKSKVALRKKAVQERKLSMILYGFPPNVGAVGTAALLNVEKSLENTLVRLSEAGYDLGPVIRATSDASEGKRLANGQVDGTDIVKALKLLSRDDILARGTEAAQKVLDSAGLAGLEVKGIVVSYTQLKSWLGKTMTKRMEDQWGALETFSDIACAGSGKFAILGLQFGNVFVAVQPLLGIEGDPMRMLFERDLTPHPQYAAFYKWLEVDYQPDTMVHFGMHGTVEWLPGSPLGNTAESWSDILLGSATNVYLYAANNPSESILAKRRGYATIVSHNVPSYSRSGLYRELQALKEVLGEYREVEDKLDFSKVRSLIVSISELVTSSELEKDLPFPISGYTLAQSVESFENTYSAEQSVDSAQSDAVTQFCSQFFQYSTELYNYLIVLEKRLFSEGLYTLGEDIGKEGILSYLDALYGHSECDGDVLEEENKTDASNSSPSGYASSLETEESPLERRKLHKETLDEIAQGVLDPSVDQNSVLIRALRRQKRTSSVNERSSSNGNTAASIKFLSKLKVDNPLEIQRLQPAASRSGVQWNEAFTDSQKFLFDLMQQGQFGAAWSFWWLGVRAAWAGSQYKEVEARRQAFITSFASPRVKSRTNKSKNDVGKDIGDAVEIAFALKHNPQIEMDGFINAIEGAFVRAAPGGDIIRDGKETLPTGSNIFALDPYRIPSITALTRGRMAANKIIEQHRKANDGNFPETVAVTLWGLEIIKTKGESLGIVLGLIGAVPVREATGRIVSFDLIPLQELGRPRIDVIASLSGIFRDTFGNVVELLDDLFAKAASEELPVDTDLATIFPPDISYKGEYNYIRKHSQAMESDGITRSSSRLFSQPSGDFGSMVNEQVSSGDWQDSSELGDQWERRNTFSFGKGSESSGTARPEVLKSLLSTTDRIIQEVESVEYGLTDIQEYYANTGAIKKAAENNRIDDKKVAISVVEAYEQTVNPKELEETLRLEYRSKLLNPAWAEGMRKQGSGGAYEISTRMTALIGWSGTCDFTDNFVYDQAAERYALDADMAAHLRQVNPEAFRNIVKRMLEANGRGMWTPGEGVLEKLQELYEETEDEIEGVM